MATHLGKGRDTAQGEVYLSFDTNGEDTRTVWRSVSDRKWAWEGDQRYDRKNVMTTLSGASSEFSRVETLEALFRATHLFGQDDQELLLQFREQSVIPADLVTRMLALDDYVTTSTKTSNVVAETKSRIEKLDVEVAQHEKRINEENARIAELSQLTSSGPMPILQMSTEIEEQLGRLFDSGFSQAEGEPSLVIAESWTGMLSGELEQLESWLALARQVKNQIDVFLAAVKENDSSKQKLEELISQKAQINGRLSEIVDRKTRTGATLAEKKNSLRKAVALVEAYGECLTLHDSRRNITQDIDSLVVGLDSNRQKQRAEASRAASIEAELKTAEQSLAGQGESLDSVKQRLKQLTELGESLADWERDTQELQEQREKKSGLSAELGKAKREQSKITVQLDAHSKTVKELQREYDKITKDDASLTKLLDELEAFVVSNECPACGTPFDDVQVLKTSIAKQKEQRSASVQERVDFLQAAKRKEDETRESLALTQQRVTDLASAEQQVSADIQQVELRLQERRQTAAGLGVGGDVSDLKGAVAVALEAAQLELGESEGDYNKQQSVVAKLTEQMKKLEVESHTLNAALEDGQTALDKKRNELSAIEIPLGEKLRSRGIPDASRDRIENRLEVSLKEKAQLEMEIGELEQDQKKDEEAESVSQAELQECEKSLAAAEERISHSSAQLGETEGRCNKLGVPYPPNLELMDQRIDDVESRLNHVRVASANTERLLVAIRAQSAARERAKAEEELSKMAASLVELKDRLSQLKSIRSGFSKVSQLLGTQRDVAVETHVQTYGPLITVLQQRLRSVHGFGDIEITAQHGEVLVEVDWDGESVKPVDYFSDSQKQILMLSVFLAGCLRQNWSRFAPVLLDDPVTHFDDLNAYAFVELIRGLINTEPNRWQFIISTCEERLFSVMQKKFSTLTGGAKFYRFNGITDTGPLVECLT